ncbi:ABC transporter substrate-binding protein [Streptomyces sp. NPDC054796]
MTSETAWHFLDDRGHRATAEHRPLRVVAYLQAAAALWDHGLSFVGVFGSQHDGAVPDRAKSGNLPLDDVPYLGAGSALRTEDILAVRPELLVAVTYDGKRAYGLDPAQAGELEKHVPTVALGVGAGHSLTAVRERFAALARALGVGEGAGAEVPGAEALGAASRRLRAAADAASRTRVLALSPAGPDSVHLARPGAWADLFALAEHGVGMVEPPAGPGANWSTTGWEEAAALAPDVVLSDVRGNAVAPVAPASPVAPVSPASPERTGQGAGWQALAARAMFVPWNPELPCSPLAHARFFEHVAEILETTARPS